MGSGLLEFLQHTGAGDGAKGPPKVGLGNSKGPGGRRKPHAEPASERERCQRFERRVSLRQPNPDLPEQESPVYQVRQLTPVCPLGQGNSQSGSAIALIEDLADQYVGKARAHAADEIPG